MKKLLVFIINALICVGAVDAAVRDGTSSSRSRSARTTQSRIATTPKQQTQRTSVVSARANQSKNPRSATTKQTAIRSRSAATNTTQKSVISRAAQSESTSMSETRTGAEYEKCKKTYFSCMDQFFTLKNDDYRRCSCNDRVFDLIEQRKTLEDANEQLTAFKETLDVVGMTYAQASAMKQASEGENALTSDKSASKALLQAIMNSISGKDTNVGGKYSDLNSVSISVDTSNAFGTSDVGQAIAAYNGLALYNAVYPQCRQVVKKDCSNASLQRAVTAYLMAIEQDCNTVQTAIGTTQKQLKSAVREGSAMLDLERVENRQKHNSSDLTTCINEIESAILSEQVCGKNYHKCLDNGEYIDISTGKPITGVTQFYKLAELLTFADGVDASKQKLSTIQRNKTFVNNFVSRVKKFAEPAMDKCVEKADIAWADYLDKALLDIYYAQRAKVDEIKRGCFDFVSSCYVNSNKAITTAMQVLTTGNDTSIQPDKIALNTQMCTDYVESCNGMFDGNIIKDYIANQKNTDLTAACRAVVQQCFDKYGGVNYQNFYYPYSGLFNQGEALDWFTLYEEDTIWVNDISDEFFSNEDTNKRYKSVCAQQLTEIPSCNDPQLIETVFGGFNKFTVLNQERSDREYITNKYTIYTTDTQNLTYDTIFYRTPRATGVATEVYNKILSVLSTQCMNLQGRFVEYSNINKNTYHFPEITFISREQITASIKKDKLSGIPVSKANNNMCSFPDNIDKGSKFNADYIDPLNPDHPEITITSLYGLMANENVCPYNYSESIDIESWGICSCWENGARRSENGKTAKCVTEYYVTPSTEEEEGYWLSGKALSSRNQVCIKHSVNTTEKNTINCVYDEDIPSSNIDKLPTGL